MPTPAEAVRRQAFNELRPPNRIRVTYRPEINHFQGQDALQVIVESWQRD
jgi:hypothetical protein